MHLRRSLVPGPPCARGRCRCDPCHSYPLPRHPPPLLYAAHSKLLTSLRRICLANLCSVALSLLSGLRPRCKVKTEAKRAPAACSGGDGRDRRHYSADARHGLAQPSELSAPGTLGAVISSAFVQANYVPCQGGFLFSAVHVLLSLVGHQRRTRHAWQYRVRNMSHL